MTPKKMKRTLLGVLVLLILSTAGGVFIANKKLTGIAEETARLSADIEVAKKKSSAYAATKERVASLDYVGDLADKVLPDSQQQSTVVAELSTFATRERLNVKGIEFIEQANVKSTKDKKTAVPKGVEVVPVVISFTDAPYERLISFMRTVEQNQRKMQVTSINLKPNEDNRSILSEVAVTLNLYVEKATEKK